MGNDKKIHCSFCNKSINRVRQMLYSGNGEVYICDSCLSKCNQIMTEALEKKGFRFDWVPLNGKCDESTAVSAYAAATPEDIKNVLDEYVIGQELAKKTLAVSIYNHRKRLKAGNRAIRKSNILLAGPSGCGKTLIAETASKILDVPFVIADATCYTQAGYIGEDVENILVRLLNAANGSLEEAEKGIVYLDEFDKLACRSVRAADMRDISGEGVQQALLKIMEGTKVELQVKKGAVFQDKIIFDTSNVLFICGGAFEGLTMQGSVQKTIGFRAEESGREAPKHKITPDKLKEYGIIPELIGRIPVIAELEPLTEKDLVRVLKDVKGSILEEYRQLFAMDGVELVFTEDAIQRIAEIAVERGTGARGLRSILEEVMLDIMYKLPSRLTGRNPADRAVTCTITGKTVISRKPLLRTKAQG